VTAYDHYFTALCTVCGRKFTATGLEKHAPVHDTPTVGFDAASETDRTAMVYLGGRQIGKSYMGDIFGTFMLNDTFSTSLQKRERKYAASKPSMREAIADQLGELTAGLDDFAGHDELPRPPRDLTTYADAFASAAAKCEHPDAENILYGREWLCPDCGRYLGRKDMKGRAWWD
jgi:hypothetical protein